MLALGQSVRNSFDHMTILSDFFFFDARSSKNQFLPLASQHTKLLFFFSIFLAIHIMIVLQIKFDVPLNLWHKCRNLLYTNHGSSPRARRTINPHLRYHKLQTGWRFLKIFRFLTYLKFQNCSCWYLFFTLTFFFVVQFFTQLISVHQRLGKRSFLDDHYK